MLNRSNLHDYQNRAVDYIINKKKCGLFLFMGAGKTPITLTAISDLYDINAIRKVLIVGPLRVVNSVWRQEAKTWAHLNHLKFSLCTGSEKERAAALNVQADIYLINRENVAWLVDRCIDAKKWPFDMVVIDESGSFKSHSAIRFKKLKKAVKHINYMVLLTGTPASNSLMDLWSQMFLIDQGQSLYKTITQYRNEHFDVDYWGYNYTIKPFHDEIIQDKIKPRVLSLDASEYIQLPERIDIFHKIQLSDKLMGEYLAFKRNLVSTLPDGKEIEAATAAVLSNKLLQWANGAIYTDKEKHWSEIHNYKLDALDDIISENPDENIIVIYNFNHDLARLQKRYPKAVMLDKNQKTIDNWNNGKIKILLAHPASCGEGINLQRGGSMIVWFGLNWNLGYVLQMNARLHRQGQSRPVRIIQLLVENTIDEIVVDTIYNKKLVQDTLMDALKNDLLK